MERHIIYNAMQTPDGTIIESTNRHDFVCHIDTKTGKRYCVDGGLDYLRRVGDLHDCEDLSLYDDEPHSVQREVLKWGTYGINGDQPLKYISIAEMNDGHIMAVLDECRPRRVLEKCMREELKFRGAQCQQ